jgi:predicted HTH transcriptional regulator
MARLSESALRRLIKGGETTTVELKLASPRPVEMAERLCGMANAQGGVVIVGVEDSGHEMIGVPDERGDPVPLGVGVLQELASEGLQD